MIVGRFANIAGATFTTIGPQNTSSIEVQDCIVDDLFVTADIESGDPSKPWDFDTILHAKFEDSLLAGNTDFALSEITNLRIKKREKGAVEWLLIQEVDVTTEEDFKFDIFDRLVKNNIEYEYAMVPVNGGIEGNYNINTIVPEWKGVWIFDKERVYHTELDVSNPVTHNKPAQVIESPMNRYPFVVSNGDINYASGTLTALFLRLDEETNDYQKEDSWQLREQLSNWLNNGHAKILKYIDQSMRIVKVSGAVSESESGHILKVNTSFGWTEIGDANNLVDLYNNDLTDIPPEWNVVSGSSADTSTFTLGL